MNNLAKNAINNRAETVFPHRPGRRKPRADKGTTKHPERRDWVKKIMSLKHSAQKGVNRLATWNAQGLALENGLPPEAADMSGGLRLTLANHVRETHRRLLRF